MQISNKNTRMDYSFILISTLVLIVNGQDRRPTISFITQPEIVTDIGATAEMECSVQVQNITVIHDEQ